MVEHLQHGPLDALVAEREDAQRHESHVRDRRVRDQLLDVRLGQGKATAEQNRGNRQPQDERAEAGRSVRKNGQADPDETVAAHLEQDARQDDAARGRSFGMRVRKPRVQRNHRQLDRESEQQGDENPCLRVHRDIDAR